jgi:flavin-dependent dehydrogenase
MEGAKACEWQAVAGLPYGWRARGTAPGLFRLGDQAAVIASLAGDGVAIALASGMGAAAALLGHGPRGAEAFQAGFAARARRPLAVASKLRQAAENGKVRGVLLRVLRLAPFLLSVGARLTRIGK